MRETPEDLFRAAGAAGWGQLAYGALRACMTGAAQGRAADLLGREPAGVFVAAFPYYSGEMEGNLSRYARGRDYHQAVTRRLEAVCGALRQRHPDRVFLTLADNSPLPEGQAARLAGLGLAGRNGLTILPPYGSWIFLGTILTNLPLEAERPTAPGCCGCGACVEACPTGALRTHDFEGCLSNLTQKKGPLTPEEARAVAGHDLAWGCDACQLVCPYNREAAETALPEFRGDLLRRLAPEDVAGLSNRAFREKYPDRSFTWRGPKPLRRNLELQRRSREDWE